MGTRFILAKARRTSENEMVQSGSSRITSRDGVNTARLFFEHHACTFQEVGHRYSRFDGNAGTGNVLLRVRRSRRRVLYRAVHLGLGTIVIGPDVPKGDCVSCATLHYFVNVVPQK